MRPAKPLLCLTVLLVASSFGTKAGDRVGIGVKAGTYGYGLDVTVRVNDLVGIRASATRGDYSGSVDDSGVEYDGDFELGGTGVTVDINPFRGNFRLSAGLFKNRNDITLDATPSQPVEIGGTVYDPADIGTLRGAAEFDDTATYLGIGYGSAAKAPGRVRFVLDAGVLRQGAPELSLSSSTGLVAPDDIQREIDEINDEVKDYDWWPVIALGISFRI